MPLFHDFFEEIGTDDCTGRFKDLGNGTLNGIKSTGISIHGDCEGDGGGLGIVTTRSTKGTEQDREARAREASHSGAENGRASGDEVLKLPGCSRVGVRAGEG